MEPSRVERASPREVPRLHRAGELASRIASLEPRDPALRRGLHAVIALAVLLGAGLAVAGALGEFPDVDWRFRPASLALGALGFVALTLLNAELWRRLLRALGPALPPLRSTTIWVASALGRYVPTSMLQPMVRVAMAEREGVPKRVCLASVAYEATLQLTGALIVGAYFLIDLPELRDHWERFLILALPVVSVIALQPAIFHRLADAALERLGRDPLPLSLSRRRVLEFTGLYPLTYVVGGLAVFALAQSVYPLSSDDIVIAIGAFAVGTVLSLIAFLLPGGLIVREAAIAVALTPAIPAAPAVAIAVLARIVQIAAEVALVMATQLLIRTRERPTPRRVAQRQTA